MFDNLTRDIMFYLLTTDKEEIRMSSPTLLRCPRQTIHFTDDDFNFRTPTNNASIELKKKMATKSKEVTWVGYRCKSCYGTGSRPGSAEFTECPFCHSSNIERLDSNTDKTNKEFWKPVKRSKCELEGPYECPRCGGHIILDATFLDQVTTAVTCPYCKIVVHTKDV